MDPLGEKLYPLSAYSYVANNHMGLIDPDGRDWAVTQNKDGSYVLTLTGKLIDKTGSNRSKDQLKAYAATINASIEKSLSGTTPKGVKVTIQSKITVAENGEESLTDSDHAFRIMKDGEMPGSLGTNLPGDTDDTGGKNVYLNESILDNKPATIGKHAGSGLDDQGRPNLQRTAAHEAGHTLGLFHVGPDEFPNQGYDKLGFHQIKLNQIPGKNLMYPSLDRNKEPEPNAGMTINAAQLNSIMLRMYDTLENNTGDTIADFPINRKLK